MGMLQISYDYTAVALSIDSGTASVNKEFLMPNGQDIAIEDTSCGCCQRSDVQCAVFRCKEGQHPAPVCYSCLYDISHVMYGKQQRLLWDQIFAEAQRMQQAESASLC